MTTSILVLNQGPDTVLVNTMSQADGTLGPAPIEVPPQQFAMVYVYDGCNVVVSEVVASATPADTVDTPAV